jgi:hypothetical protein
MMVERRRAAGGMALAAMCASLFATTTVSWIQELLTMLDMLEMDAQEGNSRFWVPRGSAHICVLSFSRRYCQCLDDDREP